MIILKRCAFNKVVLIMGIHLYFYKCVLFNSPNFSGQKYNKFLNQPKLSRITTELICLHVNYWYTCRILFSSFGFWYILLHNFTVVYLIFHKTSVAISWTLNKYNLTKVICYFIKPINMGQLLSFLQVVETILWRYPFLH